MDTFLQTYNTLNKENLHLLANIYSNDIHFIDPAHEIRGLRPLEEYFRNLYENLTSINFGFQHPQQVGDEGYVQWLMTYSHPRLNRGKTVSLQGTTFLRFDGSGKACFHRDYFDLGAMLYQHLPILGRVVRLINGRLGQ